MLPGETTQAEEGSMKRPMDQALADLRDQTLRMGGLAEAILGRAVQAVLERREDLARGLPAEDLEIDRIDVAIDRLVLRALALQAPVAEDLRKILAMKMIATDLERVGDIARSIGKSAQRLADRPPLPPSPRLEQLADDARRQLKRALDAFADSDAAGARAVLAGDDQVDDDEDAVVRDAIDEIQHHPELSLQALDLILIAKNLERVGDHATNVAESVVMAIEAQNLKHAEKFRA